MSFWGACNTLLYRGFYRLRHRRAPAPALRLPPAGGDPAVLCLGWGRIGDTILFTGVLKHFRRAFAGCRLVYAGRPEVAPVVAPFVDEFVPHGGDLARRYACILTDLHFFYGGVHALGGLMEALPAQRKFTYEGYHLGPGLAPVRIYPAGTEVIAAAGARHLLGHGAHYFAEVMRRLETGYEAEDWRPVLEAGAAPLEKFGLGAGRYVAWQVSSNNRKKDYPEARWRRVLAAFPDTIFVALGTSGSLLRAPNLLDLRGRTSLEEAIALIAQARAFLGPDSGLTHAAAVLGVPTVCVAQSSNLGTFFPYPPGFPNLRTVDNLAYRACAGCFMTCSREPIFLTRLRGAKCLRELPPEPIAAALHDALGQRIASST